MRTTSLAIVVSLSMMSCGQDNFRSQYPSFVDPEFVSYVADFESKMNLKAFYITIKFGDLPGRVMGQCSLWDDGQREIIIDTAYWDRENEIGREQLMYHELGHCAMNLDHNSATVLDPNTNQVIEASIMNPYYFGNEYQWPAYKDAYKQALKVNGLISF